MRPRRRSIGAGVPGGCTQKTWQVLVGLLALTVVVVNVIFIVHMRKDQQTLEDEHEHLLQNLIADNGIDNGNGNGNGNGNDRLGLGELDVAGENEDARQRRIRLAALLHDQQEHRRVGQRIRVKPQQQSSGNDQAQGQQAQVQDAQVARAEAEVKAAEAAVAAALQAAQNAWVPGTLDITAESGKQIGRITINGEVVFQEKEANDKGRGFNVAIVNQFNGKVMAIRTFDTYLEGAEEALIPFLSGIHAGRIVVMTIKDEGTFMLHDEARKSIADHLGATMVKGLHWRDMYAIIGRKGVPSFPPSEKVSRSPNLDSWGENVSTKATIALENPAEVTKCKWDPTPENARRSVFCNAHEGYGTLCDCNNPDDLNIVPTAAGIELENLQNVPVIVMASNRPQYLYRMLRSLLATAGMTPDRIIVFIDGMLQEVFDVTELLGVRGVMHEPQGEKNGRICYHYKYSLTRLFDEIAPSAPYTIIVEEDLEVSPDFLQYFDQTLPLMELDPTLYCISAWNDNGYMHSTKDAALLYRIETMPGLGWLLSRKLYKDELESKWPAPENRWDWDMWMRLPTNRKGRECIIPDISRTYHFGASGVNMNYYFQKAYFGNHRINKQADVDLRKPERMTAKLYEEDLRALLAKGVPLRGTNPCKEGFFPFPFIYGLNEALGVTGKHPGIGIGINKPEIETGFSAAELDQPPYLIFFKQNSETEFENWMRLAQCFRVWDLDVRGHHKGLFRFWLEGHQIMAIGDKSPYYNEYRPTGNFSPLDITGIEAKFKAEKEKNKKG
ncbi:O-linked-mannose beta-1,2-N-acetylglucosaminyltransferase 1 [Capsaspora owczarzaki ATCC 30864]|uniref:Protein O-linked-mannose beta-1,2-N-acetylglucosaminyltransferase 1 n=1 Tax=Capsaspora owczarzaki (strain ATCC 30864) TaxID=595528 RepID=A0A0D2UM96_CAPO3|nr:O-linked-mannose beta-1,2-N-acetylglucosaminyltransferase 1 [Capsaspora owczarzaki ATCC 30864]KJE96186.1 O-linked-mannose beta-1,2-N-acetylglucosaminyltransferase 1 [Capsaspora owczarzaki ATCC 30864]|eukprot:XP_004345294.1 O-linked-mannose beta-1,2-N-acetylglucosaminyltransferase 1 [Capsaspora owczarzaki ATCC 30864]